MTIYTQRNASVFVQFQLGGPSYYLGDCLDLDNIPNPRFGGIDPIQCWNRKRTGFVTKGRKYSPPGLAEVTLTHLLENTASWLEKVSCPFRLYAIKQSCGEAGVLKNWERAYVLNNVEITDDPVTQFAHHVDDNESMHEYTVVFDPPRVDILRPRVARQTTTETDDILSIGVCGNRFCDDDCGPYTLPCDNVVMGAGGGVATTANVQITQDGGNTWTAAATDPFAVNLNIMSIACFEISKGVNRILVVRNSLTATPLQCRYSDNNGATWYPLVNIGSVNTEAVSGPKGLFALDANHIWVATNQGNIYFSSDGGATWTLQASAAVASGGNVLNAIYAVDENVVFAVGDTDTIIYSQNGGDDWYAAGATGSSLNLLSVMAWNKWHILVGAENPAGAASLYMTYDGGDNWETRSYVGGTAESVVDLDFGARFGAPNVGYIATNTSGPVGSIHMTIDGGYTWEELAIPANSGLTSLVMCDVDEFFAAGNINSATGLILHGAA